MEVLTPGYSYALQNFENKNKPSQVLNFINKAPKEPGSTELVTVHDGTTNEEVLEMLVDRIKYLEDKFPCFENRMAIGNLKAALMWLNERTEGRKKRGVEGTNQA